MKSIPNLYLQSFKNATKDETDLQVIYLQIKPKTFLKGGREAKEKKNLDSGWLVFRVFF